MSVLLAALRQSYVIEAQVLEEAGFCTDADLQSLTREELNELFPGAKNLKMRRKVFEILHRQKPINEVLDQLKGFIPQISLRSALTANGVLVDYLNILKDIRTQVNNVLIFLDAHIDFLENTSKTQDDPEPDTVCSLPGTSDSACGVEPHSSKTDGPQQEAQVKYRMIVTGKTFGAHEQLMQQVRLYSQDGIQYIENSQDCQVTIVFCPIISRIGSDIEAAMAYVPDDKPLILVVMHHERKPKCITSVKQWTDAFTVNVFYHETKQGLLDCDENTEAVSKIRNELLKCCGLTNKDTNAQYGSSTDMEVESGKSVTHFNVNLFRNLW